MNRNFFSILEVEEIVAPFSKSCLETQRVQIVGCARGGEGFQHYSAAHLVDKGEERSEIGSFLRNRCIEGKRRNSLSMRNWKNVSITDDNGRMERREKRILLLLLLLVVVGARVKGWRKSGN